MTISFALTWDYRCPFARNAHEHVLSGLAAGADWDVTFLAFSLGQSHVEEGQPSVWDKPEQDSGILALQAGVIVRDHFADQFPGVHRALFAARHDQARQLDDKSVVEEVLRHFDIPTGEVFSRLDSGEALATIRDEHEGYAASHHVWGVPTFIAGDQAVFVRLMDRSPEGADPAGSVRTVERTVDLVSGWTELNEFKHTSLSRGTGHLSAPPRFGRRPKRCKTGHGNVYAMRKLVTGVDAAGRSCVVEETEFSTPVRGELIYRSTTAPPPVRPPGTGATLDLQVPPGIVRWTFVHFQPGQRAEMHHTDTIDLDTIISGSIDLVLNDGAHHLEAGDCVVVSGVDHEWLAGPQGCSWSVVMVGTPPLD